jgi:hypothetical protein
MDKQLQLWLSKLELAVYQFVPFKAADLSSYQVYRAFFQRLYSPSLGAQADNEYLPHPSHLALYV